MKKIYLSVLLLTAGVWMNHTSAATLNLKIFIAAHYIGSGQMTCSDTLTVELHDASNATVIVQSAQGILMTDGTSTFTFSNSVVGNSCYIAVKHWNAIQTWSAVPVTMAATSNYDFTLALTNAYGNNMVQVDFAPDIFGIYNGDVNQDENIDLLDFCPIDYGINNGLFGYYAEDLNCDGNVDLLDFYIYDINAALGIYSHHP